MYRVNEGSAFQIIAVPADQTGTPIVPSLLRYRIDCLTTGKEVLGWTTFANPIAGDNEISITAAHNAIIDDSNRTERKQLVVETTGSLGARNDTTDWEVVNILGVR